MRATSVTTLGRVISVWTTRPRTSSSASFPEIETENADESDRKRRPLDLAEPPHHPVQQLQRDHRLVAEQIGERVAEQPQDAHRRLRLNGRGPRPAVDRRELAEEIPGHHLPDGLPAAEHFGGPAEHDV